MRRIPLVRVALRKATRCAAPGGLPVWQFFWQINLVFVPCLTRCYCWTLLLFGAVRTAATAAAAVRCNMIASFDANVFAVVHVCAAFGPFSLPSRCPRSIAISTAGALGTTFAFGSTPVWDEVVILHREIRPNTAIAVELDGVVVASIPQPFWEPFGNRALVVRACYVCSHHTSTISPTCRIASSARGDSFGRLRWFWFGFGFRFLRGVAAGPCLLSALPQPALLFFSAT